jgi:hypothetical protein
LKSARRLVKEAQRSRAFDSIQMFDQRDLLSIKSAKIAKDQDFIKANQGGNGFWLWKPLLIDFVLEGLKPGDVLVYLDAGCELNFRNRQSYRDFEACINLVVTQGVGATFGMGRDSEFTKHETLKALNFVAQAFTSQQVDASVLFFLSSEKGNPFARKWLQYCRKDSYFNLIPPNPATQSNSYVQHNSDQSVFSILYHQASLHPLPIQVTFSGDNKMTSELAKKLLQESKLMKRSGRLDIVGNPFKYASQWRLSGRYSPIWASRNRRGIPLYAPTCLGHMSRVLRFIPIVMLRGVLTLTSGIRSVMYRSRQ